MMKGLFIPPNIRLASFLLSRMFAPEYRLSVDGVGLLMNEDVIIMTKNVIIITKPSQNHFLSESSSSSLLGLPDVDDYCGECFFFCQSENFTSITKTCSLPDSSQLWHLPPTNNSFPLGISCRSRYFSPRNCYTIEFYVFAFVKSIVINLPSGSVLSGIPDLLLS